ncbi:MAG: hypothetical protein PVG22_16640 [Chromatiales bacterium]|jgi:hypothetical protein
MNKIYKELHDLGEFPATFQEVSSKLLYHTESGLTLDEASAYAQQLSDIEEILIPEWRKRLENSKYFIIFECVPQLNGFVRIKIAREGSDPVEVFTESYIHFNAEMCDGSCYQYVYQKVLCYKEGLETKRVDL